MGTPDPPGSPDESHLRSRTGIKWSRYDSDVLPAWVADMDFDPPPVVVGALRELLDRGDLGYNRIGNALAPAYAEFQQRHHRWCPDLDRIHPFTSALHALETVLWHCTRPGDGVVVFTPIYFPFLDAIDASGRRRVEVELDPDGWRIDPGRLAAAIDETTRAVLFCQPHNPTGRVFDADELAAVAALAERHDLVVVSDEIWAELTHEPEHRPLALADDRFGGRLVTIGSASKAFNLAGLRCAVAHIDHQPLRDVIATMPSHLLGGPGVPAVAGTIAAWTEGDPWLAATRRVLTARRDQVAKRVDADLPGVRFDPPQATYLGWLDFTATRLGDDPAAVLLEEAKVALSPGPRFGSPGRGHARINFATTEALLDRILDRLASVL